MKKIQDKQIEGIIFKGAFCPYWGGLISVKVKVSSTVDYMIFQQPYWHIIIAQA